MASNSPLAKRKKSSFSEEAEDAVTDTPEIETKQEETFRQRILKAYFVRFHMGMILTSVVASGVLGSRLLLQLGIHSMEWRYPIAVLISYGVFLLMVRIWIWWITGAKLAMDLSLLDGTGSGGSGSGWGSSSGTSSVTSTGSGGEVKFGGGASGGGGASDAWDGQTASIQPMPVGPANSSISESGLSRANRSSFSSSSGSSTSSTTSGTSGGKSGGWFSDLGGLDGDDLWILFLLALLVFSIVCAGGYLIYAAPQFLPEAAWQAAFAGGLHRMSKRKPDWKMGVLRSSAIPFAVVLIMASVLGWQAQKHCPDATRLMEVFQCPAEPPAP